MLLGISSPLANRHTPHDTPQGGEPALSDGWAGIAQPTTGTTVTTPGGRMQINPCEPVDCVGQPSALCCLTSTLTDPPTVFSCGAAPTLHLRPQHPPARPPAAGQAGRARPHSSPRRAAAPGSTHEFTTELADPLLIVGLVQVLPQSTAFSGVIRAITIDGSL